MSKGRMRRGETEHFPIDSEAVWVVLVHFAGDKPEVEHINGPLAVSGLAGRLLALKGTPHTVVGVWPGQWRTDSFELDPPLLLKRLAVHAK